MEIRFRLCISFPIWLWQEPEAEIYYVVYYNILKALEKVNIFGLTGRKVDKSLKFSTKKYQKTMWITFSKSMSEKPIFQFARIYFEIRLYGHNPPLIINEKFTLSRLPAKA